MKRKGFTLIELLIVVAIIAILAAIAVPNFLEAQTRAKVSRVMADMRTIATAIEAYTVDYNRHPRDWGEWHSPGPVLEFDSDYVLMVLTTPIAYLTSIPMDPFGAQYRGITGFYFHKIYPYITQQGLGHSYDSLYPNDPASLFYGPRSRFQWMLLSGGPDTDAEFGRRFGDASYAGDVLYYDPTNGSKSHGDIYYYGPGGGFNPPPVTSR